MNRVAVVCVFAVSFAIVTGRSEAGPCFPAYKWFDEVYKATQGRSPLLPLPVIYEGFRRAAQYGVDPRLQLAIAGQETFFGLRGPCPGIHTAVRGDWYMWEMPHWP